uniref:Cytochrome P450 n=1 Tax=Oryza meridionalis TaxID=40149 RepID=A0A0E0EW50_9ORYZ
MAALLLWLSWLLLSLLSIYLLDLLAHSRRCLPPGPRPLPLIGSLHLLGDLPHRSLAGLGKTYGPLMSLRLGVVTTVVASSPEVAREFLQKHDAVFATRSTPDATGDHARNSVAWLPPRPRWRELRKIMATELFSTRRLDALHELRQEKVTELVDHVARLARDGTAVDIGRVAFTTSLNLVARTIFSHDLTSLDDHGESKEFQQVVTGIMEAVGSPNLSDFFPALAAVDLQGWRRRLSGLFARLHRLFDVEMDHRRLHGMKEKDGDFLEVLLRLAARDDDVAGLDGDTLRSLFTKKVAELVDHVARLARDGTAVDIGRVASTTSLNLIARTIFSHDLTSLDDHGASKEFQQVVTGIMEAVGSPNLSDFFPALAAVDLQGWRRRLSGLFARLHRLFDVEMDHRRLHGMKEKDGDFLEVLLRLAARDDDVAGLDGDTLRSLFTDLFTAGSDTSSSTVEWAMTELLQNPISMAKLCDELRRVVGSRRLIEESEIGKLPYLQAVIKETFRLHPPAPLLLPRQATRTIQIMGYTIPKGTRVLINVWAMGRDEDIWPEAGKFMPERFLERTIDYRGGDLELIPFGAGRRICPGMPLAVRMVHILLASLLIHFKWRLPAEVE